MQGEENTAPTSPAPVDDPHDEPWPHRYAALIAASPAISVGLELLGVPRDWWPVAVIFTAVVIALAILDARVLGRAGHQVSWWWILIPVPVFYLVHRTNRSRGPVAIPWTWAGAACLAMVFATATYEEEPPPSVVANSTDVEAAIEADYASQGRGDVTVRCPVLISGEVGDLVDCEVRGGRDLWTVEVRLDGPNSWSWHEVE